MTDQSNQLTAAARAALAETLLLIEQHDLDYPTRYGLVLDALSLAHRCGYPAGFGLDNSYNSELDGFRVVAYIDLPPPGMEPGKTVAGDGYRVSEIDEDLTRLSWYGNGAGYLKRQSHLPEPTGYQHRIVAARIFGPIPTGWEVDHIDRDPTNNTRWNLRLATSHFQKLNTRRLSVRQRANGNWQAMATVNGRQVSLGTYPTKFEARRAAYEKRSHMTAEAVTAGHMRSWPLQCSWHMPEYQAPYDKHSTEEKYARCRAYASLVATAEEER
ncbi:HNH endonuclease [Lysinibacillus fusiformis]|uniref:HNH endonuclease n=1 Tax=Lysinibacillus fusiformis TaxID=28031 RepID=UPI003D0867E6